MTSLRALLSSPPSAQITNTNVKENNCKNSLLVNIIETNGLISTRRAAFEKWHTKKFSIHPNHHHQHPHHRRHHHHHHSPRSSLNAAHSDENNHHPVVSEPCTSSTTQVEPANISDLGKRNNETLCNILSKNPSVPKLSRHNDAAYYPNIQCILCKEWVCSRNRYMHIESHLQYRPYRCGLCGYDNRKEIFINLHIRKTHCGAAVVQYKPDAEIEHNSGHG